MTNSTDSQPINVKDAEFQDAVLNSDVPVLADFWAEWCGPCKMIGPTLEELAKEFAGKLRIAKIDVDSNPETAARFGVRSIPTLILFKNGEATDTAIGAKSKAQLVEMVERHLG